MKLLNFILHYYEEKEVNIFEEKIFTSFENVFITADRKLEIRFMDDEVFSKWRNIGLNAAYILISNEDKIDDEFMEWFNSYDVDGAFSLGDHVVIIRTIQNFTYTLYK